MWDGEGGGGQGAKLGQSIPTPILGSIEEYTVLGMQARERRVLEKSAPGPLPQNKQVPYAYEWNSVWFIGSYTCISFHLFPLKAYKKQSWTQIQNVR